MFTDYGFIIDYLKRIGYVVYPTELKCGFRDAPHYPYCWVDVAASKNGKFYAFEYKSSGDPISGAVKQIDNYRKTFDYVILLVETPRKGRSGVSLNLKKGKRIYDIIRLGAGIWIVLENKSKYTIREISKPRLQAPNPLNRKSIEKTFQLYSWKDSMTRAAFHPSQQKLDQCLSLFQP